ncbi:hypothetical protein U9M48_037716 [Paspalum notatum var. saurae]|uniref:Uncharacterized protein n=1 Tax=Paspalum notatum var. saurae TaxID=547442 RepID=A0AAQ3UH08_PASNO
MWRSTCTSFATESLSVMFVFSTSRPPPSLQISSPRDYPYRPSPSSFPALTSAVARVVTAGGGGLALLKLRCAGSSGRAGGEGEGRGCKAHGGPCNLDYITTILGLEYIIQLFPTTTNGLVNGKEGVEMQYCFPRLSTLVISDCPKLSSLTLEGSSEHLLSSGRFFNMRHAGHAHGEEPLSSSCIVNVKHPHHMELKLGRLIGSSSGWDVLEHLTGLHALEISNCRDLSHLPKARCFYIQSCPGLTSLPHCMPRLALEKLMIIHNPELVRRCREGVGEYWNLVSHIPELDLY